MQKIFKQIVVIILTWEARLVLRRHRPFIIAVTGSVGKTTTKDAIFHVLKDMTSARKSEKSFNSELGVPLTILGLPNAWHSFFGWLKNICVGFWRGVAVGKYPSVLILEVGADHPGDIKRLVRWLTPDIAVLTRLPDLPVHVEFFASPNEVKKEKAELVRALKVGGIFVGCADDPSIVELMAHTKARHLLFGFDAEATVRGGEVLVTYEEREGEKYPTGITFPVFYLGQREQVTLHGVLGTPLALACLAAFAVGIARGLSLTEIAETLATFEMAPGRMRILPGKNNTMLIDDSYNSSPVAAEAALATLRSISGKRKVAMLGDMLELGEFAEEEHKKIGRIAGGFVDLLVTVGKRARWIGESAKEAGLVKEKIKEFADSEVAGKWMAGELAKGDTILLKGSQGSGENLIRMERAVKLLMAHPEDAAKLLVRQEEEWQQQYNVT
ncbi:MAG: UDP-N-acetylmuramoyl-tripeptide--D-alanyl-D-alanine ligase [bacterium]|nr:UDP-N-acetylmuramoyl-tripeptide--D-alanyl-D-alanine ligase [bacterium]